MLDVMMMEPPSFICGKACLAARNAPLTWTASTASKISSGYSATGATTPKLPALLNSTSILPQRLTVAATQLLTCSDLVTSATDQARLSLLELGPRKFLLM